MPPGEVIDSSADDFAAGATDEGAYVARTLAGEVILAPSVAGEFAGDELPPGWTVTPWAEGGTGTLGDGMLTLDGARVGCNPLLHSPRSLEIAAVFASRPDQHAGFGTNLVDVPWVMFSTKWGRRLYGRTHLISVEDKRLSGHWFDELHVFRIDWNVLEVIFSVDGARMAQLLVPVPGVMRAMAGNQRTGRQPLLVEWMRLSPYATSGTFTSRVLAAGTIADWDRMAWESEIPPGTGMAVAVRTGDVDPPDATWSPWAPVAGSDALVGATSRFLQYRADLLTADPSRTPVLRRVRVGYSAAGESSRSSGSVKPFGCQ